MNATQAQARWEAALGRPLGVSVALVYKTVTDFPGGGRAVSLWAASLDGVPQVAIMAEDAVPGWFATPDWDTVRKGKRERELDLIRLYVGQAIYRRREPGPLTEEQRAWVTQHQRQLQDHQPAGGTVELVEGVCIPDHGGVHLIFRLRFPDGRLALCNHQGRTHRPGKTVLQAIAQHPTEFFLGLDFLS